ncbi:MAG: leucine--tRNA ligase [Thaumarchaeota archaeon]|nr:leucine--tRNA ligase [Nitrososphaerota archaeon]
MVEFGRSMDKSIEDKWIREWAEKRIFEPGIDPAKEKKMVTFPFPYMNGPLHLGHGFTATRVDVFARFKRMQGFNVVFPWAWHWTGQPIVAASERLSKGDQAMIREFVEIDQISKTDLPKFYDPKFMAQYYTDSGRQALKRLGLSIDWTREFHTTDLEPAFNKFVLWQYNKLREKGYVTRGTHPVVWCPRDQSPTGDHDRVEGEGVQWEEYTLIKFKLWDAEDYLPAATFRPETIFGVTNLWISPDAEYSEIIVDNKSKWIVSADAAEKLKDQLKKIVVQKNFLGRELIGRMVSNPLKPEDQIMILPANFVDPKNGSGVVYSVPAHAPMDFVALRDLKMNIALQEKYHIDREKLMAIIPIVLITVQGIGLIPAQAVVERMRIYSQLDPKVSDATAELYKREFHQGVLNEVTGKYKGQKVSAVKPEIIEELKTKGLADSMYDLPERVVCRCLTECRVKVLEDQWFLKYSDPEWKKLAHECVDQCQMYPESIRQWFHDVVDWIKDWPCARRVGLGTPLPWSPGWIVETLSDSTIYMAFYTIRPLLVENKIGPHQLTDPFFDFVFLGEGVPSDVAKTSSVSKDLLIAARNEFLYWYPVDLRNSAKELIPNHLLFFIFQHTAFFPRSLWPKGISANGMMMVEGEKMSKSKGNVITLSTALETFGADVLRSALMDGAEGLDDMDWREKNARDIQSKINSLLSFIQDISSSGVVESRNYKLAENWLENEIQKHIKNITSFLEVLKTKSAFQEAFYSYWNDVRHYLGRAEKRNRFVLQYAAETWVRLLAPFVPFLAEEANERLNGKSLISDSPFPAVDEHRFHPDAELSESTIERLLDDSKNILKLMSQKPKELHVYVASDWSYDLFKSLVNARETGEKTSQTLEQFFSKHTDLDKKLVANLLGRITKSINELGESFILNYKKCEVLDERKIYDESKEYLEDKLDTSLFVHSGDEPNKYDPKKKSAYSLPFKPALYFE